MTNYRLEISYDGTRYNGWQRQPDKDNTIEGRIENVLSRMEKDAPPVHVIAAGRTDAGVHAKAQVANVYLDTAKTPDEIRDYLNDYLPEDIGITKVLPVPDRFHARYLATGKTYCYRIALDPASHIFERRYMTPLSDLTFRMQENALAGLPLEEDRAKAFAITSCTPDLPAIKQAAALLTGTHDFAGFCSHRMKKSTVRTITDISFLCTPDELSISFTGNGFLTNMVRILVGTLLETGFGLRSISSVEDILIKKDRSLAGFTAPAKGLTLICVTYPDSVERSCNSTSESL